MNLRVLAAVVAICAGPAVALAQQPADPQTDAPPPGQEATPPAEPEATEPAAAEVDTTADDGQASVEYDDGFKLTSADEDFAMKIQLRGQTRYELYYADGSEEFQNQFFLSRLRLTLKGHAFGERNTYKFQHDMAKGRPELKDFYINRAFAPNFHARIGQWKKPFSRQEIASSGSLEFVERSLANDWAGAGRDIGFALHNNYEKSPEGLEWAAGVFNGTGIGGSQEVVCPDPADASSCEVSSPSNVPDDFDPLFVARVGFNHGGIKGYSAADLEGGPLRVAVGASYIADFNNFRKDAEDSLLLDNSVQGDFILKVQGFDLQGAVYLLKRAQVDAQLGFFGQAGYMAVPDKVNVAGRISMIPDELIDDESIIEALTAFTWFISGNHRYKWATDAGIVQTTAGDGTTDVQVRTQLQLAL